MDIHASRKAVQELNALYAEMNGYKIEPPKEKLKTDRNMFNIPKSEQDAARERIKAKTAAKRAKMSEGVRDEDPEKGTAERKARLEKKRGMKLDDHPQYKKEEVEQVDEAGRMHSASAQQAGFQRIKDKESGGPGVGKVRSDDEIKKEKGGQAFLDRIAKAKAKMNKEEVEVDEAMSSYDRNRKRAAQRAADRNAARAAGKTGVVPGVGYVSPRKERETYVDSAGTTRHKSGAKMEEVENVDEVYKGKHGQSDKEYAASRSQGGKMISGDDKRSGAEYTHGRRVKAANPGMQPDVGGKTKPKSQGKMDAGTRADLQYRKANLRKEEAAMSPQEVALQKKKAMIDKMIAAKRMQGLKSAKKSEAPTKAMGEGKELSIDDQMRISREANAKRKPYQPGDRQKQRAAQIKQMAKNTPKDTRTDAQKMTDATGPRPGSRYRGD